MKKIMSILLILCLLLSACANAGNGTGKAKDNGKNNAVEPGATGNMGDDPDTMEPEPLSLYPA